MGLVGPGFEQQLAPALGAGQHVVVVLGLGTDARDADEAEQLVQHPRLVLLDIVFSHKHKKPSRRLRAGVEGKGLD